MFLKINNIILYPKNSEHKPRVITFEENKVNVITGYSQRGKSAIIHIIDYCLGSSDCNIPLGKIRDLVDKFAVNISLGDKYIFIARDTPEYSKSYFYYEVYESPADRIFSFDFWISDASKFKTNREELKNLLGNIAGFENISEKVDVSLSPFDAPISFRDTAAFQFQPQNVIANPTTIFFKTDTFEHIKRLKTLMPLALGYKSFEILIVEREIEYLEKEEKVASSKLNDARAMYENWQSDIYQLYTKAISLGASIADIDIQTTNVNVLKDELSKVLLNIKRGDLFKEGSSFRFTEKVDELDSTRGLLLRKLDSLKAQLMKIESLDKARNKYISDVAIELDIRLRPVDFFLKQKGANICPFCESPTHRAIDELLELKEFQVENSRALESARAISFEKERSDLKREITDIEKNVRNIQLNINILIDERREYYRQSQEIFEYGGMLENILKNLEKITPSGLLTSDLLAIQGKLLTQRNNLKILRAKFNKEASLSRVTSFIDSYVKVLPIEDRDNKSVRMDPDTSVSIKIEDLKTKNITFLSKLGSGANHMGYHMATMLGLHEYFLKLPGQGKVNYIPSFIVFDQPSQVYFPEEFPNIQDEKSMSEKSKKKTSEDIDNTTSIFNACSLFMNRTEFKGQIIVLEHAPQSTWKGIENIHLVEEWRGHISEDKENYKALLPIDWLI